MSGFYIGVDGKARKVKGGYIGVDGVARKIKKGYIGVDGVARLCWNAFEVDPVFANNSWEKIAMACQLNAVPDSWAIGDQKTMTIDSNNYTIDIIGKNHDDYADGSGKAPLTLQLHDCYRTTYKLDDASNNRNGWSNSTMRLTNLPSILAKMPSEVQTEIREVNKRTSSGNNSSQIGVTADKLFLLSEIEIFGSIKSSYTGEGTQYAYYQSGNSKIKQKSGTNHIWWERSPAKDKYNYCSVAIDGTYNTNSPDYPYGVSFAFCF